MIDHIFIEELTVFAQIGVYDWEQQIKQKLVFDWKWHGIAVKLPKLTMCNIV